MRNLEENSKKSVEEASDLLAQIFINLIDEATAEKLALESKITPCGAKTHKTSVLSIPYSELNPV